MRCPGKEAIEAHFMSAVKEVIIENQSHKIVRHFIDHVKHNKVFIFLARMTFVRKFPTVSKMMS